MAPIILNKEVALLVFLETHKKLLESHAWRLGPDHDEIIGKISEIFYEKIDSYDERKGSLFRFLIGHLLKRHRRTKVDALFWAISIDDDSEYGQSVRHSIESIHSTQHPENSSDSSARTFVPGASNLQMIADAIDGKSSVELAHFMRRSKRRINQLIQQTILTSNVQFSLDFSNEKEDA